MMGGKVGGTLPPLRDKYEKMEPMARGLLPKVSSTSRNKSPSHPMPSNRGNSNLDNGNQTTRSMVKEHPDVTRNQEGNYQRTTILVKR